MMTSKNTTDSPEFWADPLGGQQITTSLAEYTELANRPEEFFVTKDIREFRNDFQVYLDEKKYHVAKYVLPFKQTGLDGKEKPIDFEFRPGELTLLAGEMVAVNRSFLVKLACIYSRLEHRFTSLLSRWRRLERLSECLRRSFAHVKNELSKNQISKCFSMSTPHAYTFAIYNEKLSRMNSFGCSKRRLNTIAQTFYSLTR